MRARPIHYRAGFVVCLHTVNLRKEYEPYIGVVLFPKTPLTSMLHWLPTCELPLDEHHLWTDDLKARRKEVEVWLLRADELMSLESKIFIVWKLFHSRTRFRLYQYSICKFGHFHVCSINQHPELCCYNHQFPECDSFVLSVRKS